jgi:gamma-glutamylcyclotransferase (GGCT)/AIG2-like uncharacterized protein YtfP
MIWSSGIILEWVVARMRFARRLRSLTCVSRLLVCTTMAVAIFANCYERLGGLKERPRSSRRNTGCICQRRRTTKSPFLVEVVNGGKDDKCNIRKPKMKVPTPPSPPSSAAVVLLQSLFVYGTLMAPTVVETVIGRRLPNFQRASLDRYVRHPVRDRAYPGMIRSSSSSSSSHDDSSSQTVGILLTGLSLSELKRLDYYEDVDYTREEVSVSLLPDEDEDGRRKTENAVLSNNQSLKAVVKTYTYVWTSPLSLLDLTQEWSFETFRRDNLQDYLLQSVQPCRDQLDRLGCEFPVKE